jgi:septal ring factor EnvC (AmiA/AmiB activator)
MHNFLPRMSLVGIALTLCACTGETDPSRAGFFDGMNNLATGNYQRRADERRLSIAEEETRALQARIDSEEAARKQREIEGELVRREARIAALERDVTQIERQLVELRQRRDITTTRRAELERQIAALRLQSRGVTNSPTATGDADLRAAETRRDELSRAMRAALGY